MENSSRFWEVYNGKISMSLFTNFQFIKKYVVFR